MEYWRVVKKSVFESILHHSSTPILLKYSELKDPSKDSPSFDFGIQVRDFIIMIGAYE